MKQFCHLAPWLEPYLLAALSVGIATFLRWLLDPILGDEHPLILYYGALAVAAWHGGLWPALLALVSGYLVADWFFISPRRELSVFTGAPIHLVGCGTYMVAGTMIAAFSEVAKRARGRAEAHAESAQEKGRRLEREIVERRRAEEEVRRLNLELEQRVKERTAELLAANKELETFSYSVSHDLRAPLRSINAFTQLVQENCKDKLNEQNRQYLAIVSDSSQRMAQLIDDLLRLSRAMHGELHRREVSLSEMARQIIGKLQRLERQREVEVVIAPNLLAEGDERLLQIALENLLDNAWKFTAKLPKARIEVGSEQLGGGQTVYFVRDNGAGFDMAYADKLFRTFHRLHSEVDFPGTGIGLAIVQRIINRHGGWICTEGAVNKGATFKFTLSDQKEPAGSA